MRDHTIIELRVGRWALTVTRETPGPAKAIDLPATRTGIHNRFGQEMTPAEVDTVRRAMDRAHERGYRPR